MKKKLLWEQIPNDSSGHLFRTPVPGGWLVKEVQDVQTTPEPHEQGRDRSGHEWRSTMCFVPDEHHAWSIIEPEPEFDVR